MMIFDRFSPISIIIDTGGCKNLWKKLQNDEVINLYSYNIYNDEIDECIDNIVNQIPSGSTVKVAQILELNDWTSPVKIRVNDANAFNQDMTKQQMQQQEINIQ